MVNANTETTFLEVGVGSGRIAVPLASLSHMYTGVDISENMIRLLTGKLLANNWEACEQVWGSWPDEIGASTHSVWRFREAKKHAVMRIVLSDITALPFSKASFDVVLAVHVFHLVDGWQQAMCEIVRVLRPGGVFLHGWDELVNVKAWPVGETWGNIVRELGYEVKRPGASARSEVTVWLNEQGFLSQESPVVQWEVTETPREAVEQVTRRLWSGTWVVPDEIFAPSVERLESWAKDYFGSDMDTQFKGVRQFVICKTEV